MITVVTSANIQKYRQIRDEEYKNGLRSLLILSKTLDESNKIFVLECFQKAVNVDERLSWLSSEEDFRDIELIFSNTHKEARNKGVLEMLAVRKMLNQTHLNPEEFLMKQTGRYSFYKQLLSEHLKEAKSKNLDGIIRYDDHGQVFFGAIVMKVKHWKKFVNELDYQLIERNMVNIELCLSNFLKENKVAVLTPPELGMKANIDNSKEKNLSQQEYLR